MIFANRSHFLQKLPAAYRPTVSKWAALRLSIFFNNVISSQVPCVGKPRDRIAIKGIEKTISQKTPTWITLKNALHS